VAPRDVPPATVWQAKQHRKRARMLYCPFSTRLEVAMPYGVVDLFFQALLTLYPFRSGRKKLARFAASKMSGPVVWQTKDGTRLLLDLKNYIDREVVIKGGFEASNIDFMCKKIASYNCDTFVDIGANIGLYSIAVARRTAVQVIAFEPDPRNHCQMAANLFLNGLDAKVELHEEAVGPSSEEKVLYAQRDTNNLSTALSRVDRAGEGTIAIRVEAVSLDEKFDLLEGRSVAVKMDIEGFELEALAGMAKFLKRNRIFLQIEIAPENRALVRLRLAALGLVELPQLHQGTADFYFESAEV
jgi:FkbM family methyltransferase